MEQKAPYEQSPGFLAIRQAITPLSLPPLLGTVPMLEVWLANLALLHPIAHVFATWLDDDDRNDIARLRQPADQNRMLVRRGLRRWLLARHLLCAPEQLHFARGPWNKPLLREPAGVLHFNTAGSADWFLLGLASDTELGVDIESVSRFEWSPDVAEVVCSTRERQQLAALPEAERRQAFLRLWTAKEAVLKLRGTGFHEPADVRTLLENLHADESVVELSADPDVVIHLATRYPRSTTDGNHSDKGPA